MTKTKLDCNIKNARLQAARRFAPLLVTFDCNHQVEDEEFSLRFSSESTQTSTLFAKDINAPWFGNVGQVKFRYGKWGGKL